MREVFRTFGVKEEIEEIIRFYKGNEERLVFSSQLFRKVISGTGNEIEIEFLLFIKTLVEEMIKERRTKDGILWGIILIFKLIYYYEFIHAC